jgi:hypothetical protein
MLHMIWTQEANHLNAMWWYNGDPEFPTFNPSINIDMGGWPLGRAKRCHYFVRAGKLEFCTDSTHSLAGKAVDMPDIPADEDDLYEGV